MATAAATDSADHDAVRGALREGDLRVVGVLAEASNATFRAEVDGGHRCVYKPVRGERPLWDFPARTLGRREVALAVLSDAVGWSLVPPTVWRDDGPLGPGMCQLWVDADEARTVVDVLDASVLGATAQDAAVQDDVALDGWLPVVRGRDGRGRDVIVAHRDDPVLQQVVLLDAIANNADRKGGHLVVDADGAVWAIDHGVTFHAEDKLRTVLWGWAGEPIPATHLPSLARAREIALNPPAALRDALDADELRALRERIDRLLADGIFPLPSTEWPSLPWPLF